MAILIIIHYTYKCPGKKENHLLRFGVGEREYSLKNRILFSAAPPREMGTGKIMKVAQTAEGKPITADATAPSRAICPICGGKLSLRSRKTMNNGQRTYYWRHRSNHNRFCSARNRPFS
jgi:hypothetical protein